MRNSPHSGQTPDPDLRKGSETIEMVTIGAKTTLDRICSMDQSSPEKRKNKQQVLAEHIKFLQRKIKECGDDQASKDSLQEILSRAQKVHETLDESIDKEGRRLIRLEDTRKRFSNLLEASLTWPERAKKKATYLQIIRDLQNPSMVGHSTKREEVGNLLLLAEELYTSLEIADIEQELEQVRQADQDGQEPEVLKSLVDALLERAKSVNPPLAEEIAEVQAAIQNVLEEKNKVPCAPATVLDNADPLMGNNNYVFKPVALAEQPRGPRRASGKNRLLLVLALSTATAITAVFRKELGFEAEKPAATISVPDSSSIPAVPSTAVVVTSTR